VAIGHEANLPATYSASTRANTALVDETIFNDISTHVQATDIGYNLISITYDNPSPAVAQRVVQAVVNQYGISASQFATGESQQLLLIYQQQLQQAQAASSQATSAAATYLRSHPDATIQNDPHYNVLQNNATNALSSVNSVQDIISQINTEMATIGSGSNTLFSVVDKPSAGSRPVSRTKVLLTGGAIGLTVGLLACIVFIVIMMRRDRSIYSVSDLQRVTGAQVLMQIPQMPTIILAQSAQRLEGGGRLSSDLN
jgi:uncharacterized protein involved in exopolysaccharide biosynthesis